LGMVVQWEDRFHGGNRAHTYLGAGHDEEPYPDFVTLAKGFRAGAKSVSRREDLDAALEEMLDSKGPYVLDVLVPYQEHVLPMIPGGMTVRDIIKAWFVGAGSVSGVSDGQVLRRHGTERTGRRPGACLFA